jgi:polyisoprenoid-binding protein YceI
MKKYFIVLTSIITVVSCNSEKKPTVDTQDAVTIGNNLGDTGKTTSTFQVDSKESTLQWEGYEGLALGKSEHNGTLNIKSGIVTVSNKKPVSGKFLIDINSLKVDDIPSSKPGNAKLKKHLLSADFFDAAQHPDAVFEITSVVENGTDSVHITGNLQLKGTTKSITIPAYIKTSDTTFTATSSKFYINRNDWGMYYRSENSLGNEMIRNEMGIIIKLTAKR